MKVDLHCHSYYSDGVHSPSEVIELANQVKCDLFSLTDHDTTVGVLEAQERADDLSLNFIPGVEISAFWQNMTIHILGIGVNVDNDILQKGLRRNQELRKERAEKIAHGLRRTGIKDVLEKTRALSKTNMITRTHFAQMLIQEGYCKDMKSVFRRFLTGNKPGAVRVEWSGFEEVISWIHASGGLSVIAHPFRYRMTQAKIKRMFGEFKEAYGDGVEVITAMSSEQEINLCSNWAKEINLLISSGSDYHGWPNQRINIGSLKEIPNSDNLIWNHLSWQR
jgi:predicted metal-dependent phosphoesterase TrpH